MEKRFFHLLAKTCQPCEKQTLHGPSAWPQQTSRLIEPLSSFGKLQEEKPMDTCVVVHMIDKCPNTRDTWRIKTS